MTHINRMLKESAKARGDLPYWVVEKDYALSYLLTSLADADEFGTKLLLKGGTALSKAYFEDYRLSEDLDLSVRPAERLDTSVSRVGGIMTDFERLLQEQGAFLVAWERLTLRLPHPGGQDAFIVRVQFPGQRQPFCRLKLEITTDELILWPAVERPLIHNYPENLAAQLQCYSIEEITAEKLRALLQSRKRLTERGWGASRVCRDYYDLWRILGDRSPNREQFIDRLALKCTHREVAFDSAQDFLDSTLLQVAAVEWDRQLAPFVPACPAAERILGDLQTMIPELLG